MATATAEPMKNLCIDALWIDEGKATAEPMEEERRKSEPLGGINLNSGAEKKKRKAEKKKWKEDERKREHEAMVRGFRKKASEVDHVAAAVYKAQVEETDRKQQRKEKLKAVKKWIATGDPEARLYWKRWMAEEITLPDPIPDEDSDLNATNARDFREFWDYVWARTCGSFEDTTAIGPMRFTDEEPPRNSGTENTLQVFSVRITEIKEEEIQWPIDVFGIIAARDCLDQNRIIIFDRKRDDCQTITKESPYLTLTGPTRAVIVLDPVSIEVVLRVKCATESEDKDLSFLVVSHRQHSWQKSFVVSRVEASKLSTLELTFGHIFDSVEATISVKVIGAKLPQGFRRAQLTANTASIDDQKILLLAFGDDDESPFVADAVDGTIQLFRRVVCVELEEELIISVKAQCDDSQAVEEDHLVFKPMKASRSYDVLQVCSCEMEVTVAWSLLCDY